MSSDAAGSGVVGGMSRSDMVWRWPALPGAARDRRAAHSPKTAPRVPVVGQFGQGRRWRDWLDGRCIMCLEGTPWLT